jgi:hypothetical protein
LTPGNRDGYRGKEEEWKIRIDIFILSAHDLIELAGKHRGSKLPPPGGNYGQCLHGNGDTRVCQHTPDDTRSRRGITNRIVDLYRRSSISPAEVERKAVAHYKVMCQTIPGLAFRRDLFINDEGIHVISGTSHHNHVPFGAIVDCSYLRRLSTGICRVKYVSRDETTRTLSIWGVPGALRERGGMQSLQGLTVYCDVLRVSRHQGHEIIGYPDAELPLFLERLECSGSHTPFLPCMNPSLHIWQEEDGCHWTRQLGAVVVSGNHYDQVSLSETGVAVVKPSILMFASQMSCLLKCMYHIDFTICGASAAHVDCCGTPVRGFVGRLADYRWSENESAARLSSDSELTRLLKKAKAPPISIGNNLVHIDSDRLPDKCLLKCVDVMLKALRA